MFKTAAAVQRTISELARCFLEPGGRTVALAVTAAATSVTYPFASTEVDTNYGAVATPNWNTTAYVSARTTTSLTVSFGTAAPANATVSILVFRA